MRLRLATNRLRAVTEELTLYRQAQISHHPAQRGHGGTHRLPNQAIRLRLATIRLRAVTEELTVCRIKPSSSDQPPSGSEQSRRNSHSVESSHRDQISDHPAESGHGGTHRLPNQAIRLRSATIRLRGVTEEVTLCRIKPSGSD